MLRRLLAALAIALAFALPAFAQNALLPPGQLCFQAQTGVAGMIGVLGTITPGSGGAQGTYVAVPLTGGSGSGATANVTVNSSGQVSQVVILNPGLNYQTNDSLSAASATIGGVSGFSVPVNSTSINSSLAGGTVAYYIPGTLTVKQTYQNASGSILNQNPVQLNSNGCATVWGSGSYRQILYDSLGNEVSDSITTVPTASPFWAGLAGGTSNAITVVDAGFSASDGQAIQFVALNANTGATTITPSGTGTAVAVDKNSPSGPVPLTGNEIVAGDLVTVTYYAAQNYFLLDSYNRISAAMTPVVSASTTAAAAGAMGLTFGQGYFSAPTNGGTQVQFCPSSGSYVTIAGSDYAIPSGCVSATITNCYVNGVSGQALVAGTLYYAYVFNNSGTLTLDFSTTGHQTDVTAGNVGVEIENGNNTRSLVGMLYPQGGPVVNNAGANLLVLSWFNRHSLAGSNAYTANQSTSNNAYFELSSSIRIQFLTWANEAVSVGVSGGVSGSSNTFGSTTISFNGVNVEDVQSQVNFPLAAPDAGVAISYNKSGLSEGEHFVTVMGLVSSGTGTWFGGGSPGSRVAMTIGIRG